MGGRPALVERPRRHARWLVLGLHPIPRGADPAAAPAGAVAARGWRRPLPGLGLPWRRPPAAFHPLVDDAHVPGLALVAHGRRRDGYRRAGTRPPGTRAGRRARPVAEPA